MPLWRKVRIQLLLAYFLFPGMVVALAVAGAFPLWLEHGPQWSTIVPVVLVAVPPLILAFVLACNGLRDMEPVVLCVIPLALLHGLIAMVSNAYISSIPGAIGSFSILSFFGSWGLCIAAAVFALLAASETSVPQTPEWGETDIIARFSLKTTASPRIQGFAPGPSRVQLLLAVTATGVSVAMPKSIRHPLIPRSTEGIYGHIPLVSIRECVPVVLSPPHSPWLVLKSGIEIWAAQGEAIVIRTREGEWMVPLDNAGVVADFINRRARRAIRVKSGSYAS